MSKLVSFLESLKAFALAVMHWLTAENLKVVAQTINSWVIPAMFVFITAYAYAKKVKVYETFVEGAREGFNVAVSIIPYLVVILAAIAIFRAGGAMEIIAKGFGTIIPASIFPTDVILLTLIKPLSGSAARSIMLDIFSRYGVDSYTGFLASTIQGSTETTFYVIAVYYGSINVRKTRYTIPAGLLAELVAVIVAATLAVAWFYHAGR